MKAVIVGIDSIGNPRRGVSVLKTFEQNLAKFSAVDLLGTTHDTQKIQGSRVLGSSDCEALWVIRKSQVAIPEGFCVALGLEIGNTIHNFEPGGKIQFVKAHAVAELGGGWSCLK